jgi:hypothetical protein
MNTNVSNISEEAGVYKFTLSGLNVSLANSIRRTILSDIPINVIKTETFAENQCNILINTSRLHQNLYHLQIMSQISYLRRFLYNIDRQMKRKKTLN